MRGVDVQRIVVVGLRHPVMKIHHYLNRNTWTGMQLIGYFSTSYDVSVSEYVRRLPCLGIPDRLFDFLEKITLSKYGFRCLSVSVIILRRC